MGHFYDTNGNPMHTVPNVSRGGARDTTIRDAKKLKLAHSVSAVLGVQDAPNLTNYKINETLSAAIEHPFVKGVHNREEWVRKIRGVSREKGDKAAKRGSELHAALEFYYLTGRVLEQDKEFVEPAILLVAQTFPGVKWIPEMTFTSKTNGYGGTVDLHSAEGYVLDFKTKDTKAFKSADMAYEDHHMQTAAYAVGLHETGRIQKGPGEIKRFNLFISREDPAILQLTQSTDFDRDWKMFYLLNEFFKIKNNIDWRL